MGTSEFGVVSTDWAREGIFDTLFAVLLVRGGFLVLTMFGVMLAASTEYRSSSTV